MNRITILTEVGKNIGFGHYTRCSSLQSSLIKIGFQVRFIVYSKSYTFDDSGILEFNWINSIDDVSPIDSTDIAVVDSYLAKKETYKKLKDKFKIVIAIDDFNRIYYPVDIIINPNVFFENIDYSNQTAQVLGGKEYVILRPEFSQADISYSNKNNLKNILITIGGSDFRNLLPKLISISDKVVNSNITIIDPENKLKNTNDVRVLPKQSAVQMAHQIQQADLVISACGQTLHELVALNKVCIGICLDIDQIPNQLFYFNSGYLYQKLNWDDLNLLTNILDQIEYYSNSSNRKRIFRLCKTLISKNGASVIATFIKDLK